MESEQRKIGFFGRLKIAITKLDEYTTFLEEKKSVAIRYFFLIVLILSIALASIETNSTFKMVNAGYNYIKNELPNFSYENGELSFDEYVYGYDQEYDMYMIADTSDNVSDEKIDDYKNQIKTTGMIFLKDKMIYCLQGVQETYNYKDIENEHEVETFNKRTLINKIDEIGMAKIIVAIFIIIFAGIYISEIIIVFMDWILIMLFAIISSKFCRVKLSFKNAFNISIYALSLSIILSMLYEIANYITGFYISEFRTIYLLISYVYVVAAILMMKSDVIKQQIEVQKIVEVQKEVHDEEKDPDEKDKEENKEPDNKENTDENQKDSNDEEKEQSTDNEVLDGEVDGSEI